MKILLYLSLVFLLAVAKTVVAGSATWNLNPASGDWNNAANWTPNSVPNGPSDTATFSLSNVTAIAADGEEVNSIIFAPGADAYTIDGTLIISGAGIANNSGVVQSFLGDFSDGLKNGYTFINNAVVGDLTSFNVPGGLLSFENTASGGNGSFTVTGGSGFSQGILEFHDQTTAGDGTYNFERGPGLLFPYLFFLDDSTAGSSNFTVNNSTPVFFENASKAGTANFIVESGSRVQFRDSTRAEDATFTVHDAVFAAGAGIVFRDTSSASRATLVANDGGIIIFVASSDGELAQVRLSGTGELRVAEHRGRLRLGSLEGDGEVILGSRRLNLGANNLSTTFNGLIKGNGGSLIKEGYGALTLGSANTYSGGTTETGGILRVANSNRSATGSGAVDIAGGTFGGPGIVAGAVTIGAGNGSGAVLGPSVADSEPATLTIRRTLTFKADGTYTYKLNTENAQADQVIANGVTIESGAQFDFNAVADQQLTTGATFTAISNTSVNPINGAFANLPDNSTFTAGRNTFQASYSGGDGNDLTLTVVP